MSTTTTKRWLDDEDDNDDGDGATGNVTARRTIMATKTTMAMGNDDNNDGDGATGDDDGIRQR